MHYLQFAPLHNGFKCMRLARALFALQSTQWMFRVELVNVPLPFVVQFNKLQLLASVLNT